MIPNQRKTHIAIKSSPFFCKFILESRRNKRFAQLKLFLRQLKRNYSQNLLESGRKVIPVPACTYNIRTSSSQNQCNNSTIENPLLLGINFHASLTQHKIALRRSSSGDEMQFIHFLETCKQWLYSLSSNNHTAHLVYRYDMHSPAHIHVTQWELEPHPSTDSLSIIIPVEFSILPAHFRFDSYIEFRLALLFGFRTCSQQRRTRIPNYHLDESGARNDIIISGRECGSEVPFDRDFYCRGFICRIRAETESGCWHTADTLLTRKHPIFRK